MRCEGSCHLSWRERDFREFGALQNFAMHLAVAAVISALATGCVDDNCAIRLASCGIKPDRAALEFENPVNGMQNVTQRKGDFRLSRVELDDGFPGVRHGSKHVSGEQNDECCQQNAHTGKPGTRSFTGFENYARKSFHPKSTISDAPSDESESSPVWIDKSLENRAGFF